jgi:hypothetical protein
MTELGIDVTSSTSNEDLHALYRAAALAVVDRAAAERAALRIVAFGASGVGATVLFDGSFAPAAATEVENLAAANRARCWARVAIERALATPPSADLGSDVAGAAASLITHARSVVEPGKPVTVFLATDGCQSPSRSGPNRNLTDLCRKLARGVDGERILQEHEAEFALPSADVTLIMKGIGLGRRQDAASTERTARLVAFWQSVCERGANARACLIGSALP